MTVASAATHPAGGPVSPAQPVTDSYALEWDDVSALQLESAAVSAAAAAAAAVSDLVEINLPPAVNEREAKYIADSSPLTEHERNGAWLLAGGIAGVFLVGGIASKKSHEKNHKKVEDKKADDKKD